jgi:hypothetical protein
MTGAAAERIIPTINHPARKVAESSSINQAAGLSGGYYPA